MLATDAKRLKEPEAENYKFRNHCYGTDLGCFDAQGAPLGKFLTPDRRRSAAKLLQKRLAGF
jgi:hypothetical protein